MSTLVECPICRGDGVLTWYDNDPQGREDDDCHACAGGGAVTREHHAQLVEQMTDVAAIAALQRLAADDAAAIAEIERRCAR